MGFYEENHYTSFINRHVFGFDVVAWICGGQGAVLSRIIYTVVALAGIWCISLLFRSKEDYDAIEQH